MLGLARIVVPGEAHHITQRGNNRQDVFFVEDDRKVYLGFLREYAERYRFAIHGYCLMTNPPSADLRPRAYSNSRYIQHINAFHGRSGHLWQGRFHSCALDEGHYGNALHYVEQNPVRAKMVRKAWRYPWSSAGAHCGTTKDDGLLDLAWWREALGDEARWKGILEEQADPAFQQAFRLNTHIGRPLGSDSFLSKLEHALGRRVRALPHGRPRGK